MSKWSQIKANEWYGQHNWIVGCNFLPSSAVNQLEMFQKETFDEDLIKKELIWAQDLGFNTIRVYLHDLLWQEKEEFNKILNNFLNICKDLEIKPMLVLFDDCHRPNPTFGKQELPIKGVHNSGWSQSPGFHIVKQIHNDNDSVNTDRLKKFVQEVLDTYGNDDRILMWDIYNEPGQFGSAENSLELLKLTWKWAHDIRPKQPLTSCLNGSIGEDIINLNREMSDIITFHAYEGDKLESIIDNLKSSSRPIICTEYMARPFGTTFEKSLPIFKKNNIGCYNWGLVAGKSQTHFGWETIIQLEEKRKKEDFLFEDEQIPEPKIWFHDIFRHDGSAYDPQEIKFIKEFIKSK